MKVIDMKNFLLRLVLGSLIAFLLTSSLSLAQELGIMMNQEGMKQMKPDQISAEVNPKDSFGADSRGKKLLQRY